MKTFTKIKNFSFDYWQELMLGFFIVLFFVTTSSFLFLSQNYSSDLSKQADFVKWGSPDETANYIFAKLYAQEGKIQLEEKYNLSVDDIMHPRSLRSDYGFIKPVSFLGIILIYGKIASIFGYKIIPFLTPFFASLGIAFFYLFIRRLFGRQNAFVASSLLVFFPPFFYYTTRSMFHNVLFVVLLLISLYFSLLIRDKSLQKKKKWRQPGAFFKDYIFSSLAGFFLGLTIMTRASELLWLLPLFFLLWIFNIKKVGIVRLLLFLSFLFLGLAPMFHYNQVLYGSYFNGGYPEMNQSIQTLTEASGDLITSSVGGKWSFFKNSLEQIKNTIFHFGFDGQQSKLMFQFYFVNMFAFIFWSALFGLTVFFVNFKKIKYKQGVYLFIYFLISFILVVYYGSWEFHDNPDLKAVTIGNSYTRYWLPVYLGALPLAGLFLIRLSRRFCLLTRGKLREKESEAEAEEEVRQASLFKQKNKQVFCQNFLVLLIITVFFFFSLRFVLYGSGEGLAYTLKKAQASQAEWSEVLELTEKNSAIITRYHDKLFFPERKVIVGLFDDRNMNERYARLAKKLPLYYYNFDLGEDAIQYLNTRRLKEVGLHIELVEKVNNSFSLYRLTSITK